MPNEWNQSIPHPKAMGFSSCQKSSVLYGSIKHRKQQKAYSPARHTEPTSENIITKRGILFLIPMTLLLFLTDDLLALFEIFTCG